MIHVGDVFDVLPTIPDGSVRTCVTSPPYWGLRDYGTAEWEGGDEGCDHGVGRFTTPASEKQQSNHGSGTRQAQVQCPKCGATRIDAQLGLEETPEQYVENMVRVFREVRRILTDDGTLWLNLGDSYASSVATTGRNETNNTGRRPGEYGSAKLMPSIYARNSSLKPKDLCGIPWRVAFALQADGWYLRSDIIWAKPNPMPESVTDRPTKSHEYIFLLSKNQRYYYDHQAIAERASDDSGYAKQRARGVDTWQYGRTAGGNTTNGIGGTFGTAGTRNRRSVWTINTKPFPEAHFAVFPLTLPMLCIQAGTATGDTVLDPFAGAGTTGVAAQKLGREFVGVELNPEYAAMAERRIAGTPLSLFAVNE